MNFLEIFQYLTMFLLSNICSLPHYLFSLVPEVIVFVQASADFMLFFAELGPRRDSNKKNDRVKETVKWKKKKLKVIHLKL